MAPNHEDTKERKAKCLFHLEQYEECISCLNDVLANKENSELRKLKENAEAKLVRIFWFVLF